MFPIVAAEAEKADVISTLSHQLFFSHQGNIPLSRFQSLLKPEKKNRFYVCFGTGLKLLMRAPILPGQQCKQTFPTPV